MNPLQSICNEIWEYIGLVFIRDQYKYIYFFLTRNLEIERSPRKSKEMVKYNRGYSENFLLAYEHSSFDFLLGRKENSALSSYSLMTFRQTNSQIY